MSNIDESTGSGKPVSFRYHAPSGGKFTECSVVTSDETPELAALRGARFDFSL